MRKIAIFTVCAAALFGAATLGAQESERQTLTGEIIDIASYAMRGAQGAEHAEAMRFRVEKGFPVGLLTEDGEVFIAVYRDPAPAASLQTANRALVDLVGKEVVCQGHVYRKSGIALVEIAIVSEM